MADVAVRSQIEHIAREYAKLISKEMKVEGVYLFGSYVEGDYSEDSDIDIAVISDEFVGDIIEDTFKLMKLRRKVDNRIEPHPIKKNDLNEPFIKEILGKSLRID
jgi:predicted nucleotidyltransferase